MSAGVLVIGLDACDPDVVQRFAADGLLPNVAALLARGGRAPVRNPFGLFVGSVWRSIARARFGHRIGRPHWDVIDPETYEYRMVDPDGERGRDFWLDLSDAGHRVAVIDVPHSRPAPLNGLFVTEWGCHDRHIGLRSWPEDEAARIVERHGMHPVFGIDPFAVRDFAADDAMHRAGMFRNAAEEQALLDGLLAGLATKQRWVVDRLRSEEWALFTVVFGEGHAVGHQQWHLHDASHPRHDASTVNAVGGDPLLRMYQALDNAVGALVAETDEDTTVLLLLSHGMGPHYDGTHLLDELLRRIDMTDHGGPLGGVVARAGKRALLGLPVEARRRAFPAIAAVARERVRRHPPERSYEWMAATERATRSFFTHPNNYVYGGVRINVIGRDRHGVVDPVDVDRMCAALADDLRSVVNIETGRPIINEIHRTEDHYDREPNDALPDLFLEWERSHLIETVWSPKTGVVHVPYENWRSGDHRPKGVVVVVAPNVGPGAVLPELAAEDVAPTIAARFGVRLSDADGHPSTWGASAVEDVADARGRVPVGDAFVAPVDVDVVPG